MLAVNTVSFAYSGKKEDYLYRNLDLSVDLDSRIAVIGPNGGALICSMRAYTQTIICRDVIKHSDGVVHAVYTHRKHVHRGMRHSTVATMSCAKLLHFKTGNITFT